MAVLTMPDEHEKLWPISTPVPTSPPTETSARRLDFVPATIQAAANERNRPTAAVTFYKKTFRVITFLAVPMIGNGLILMLAGAKTGLWPLFVVGVAMVALPIAALLIMMLIAFMYKVYKAQIA